MFSRNIPSAYFLSTWAWIAGALCAALPAHGVSPCDPRWAPNAFSATGADGSVQAFVQFDADDVGTEAPATIVAGSFSQIGAASLSRIARRDGGDWAPLGTGLGSTAFALAVFDEDGLGPNPPRLFAGGRFTTAGGGNANRIARWNGTSWSPLGSGLNDDVYSMIVFDEDGAGPGAPALYVAGQFTTAGGNAALHVARWTGSAWQAVGTGVGTSNPTDVATSLCVFDEDGDGPNPPRLFAGGQFFVAGSESAFAMARWDGSAWSGVGSGLFSSMAIPPVQDMTVFDDDGPGPNPSNLYVVGHFDVAGGVLVENVAKWDGSNWQEVGGGIPSDFSQSYVFTATPFDEDGDGPALPVLYIGGQFYRSTPEGTAEAIVKWDGSDLHKVSEQLNAASVRVLESIDEDGDGPGQSRIFAGGTFTMINGIGANRLACYDGNAWSLLVSSGGLNDFVYSMLRFDEDGSGPLPDCLYVTGRFITGGSAALSRIAKWDGANWFPLGEGISVPSGYAGGAYGGSLATLDDDGSGPNPPSLVLGGRFTMAGNVPANSIARWDGANWHAMGNGLELLGQPGAPVAAIVWAITQYDPDGDGPLPSRLFAGGAFNTADGQPVDGLAQWDGVSWSGLGLGSPGSFFWVNALAVFDADGPGPMNADLYVGGNFTTAGGGSAKGIAKWDGANWSALATGLAGAGSSTVEVFSMQVFDDDGPGPNNPALFVGGAFSKAGSINTGGFAKWNGSAWSVPAGSPVQGLSVRSLAVWDEDGPGSIPECLIVAMNSSTHFVYRWSGATWTSLGTTSLSVRAIAPFGGNGTVGKPDSLYLGGTFNSVNGIYSSYMARYERPYGLLNGDMNYDGLIDGQDVQVFVDSVLNSSASPVHLCKGSFVISLPPDIMSVGDTVGFVNALLSE